MESLHWLLNTHVSLIDSVLVGCNKDIRIAPLHVSIYSVILFYQLICFTLFKECLQGDCHDAVKLPA